MNPVGFVRSLGNRSLSLLMVLLLHSALSSRLMLKSHLTNVISSCISELSADHCDWISPLDTTARIRVYTGELSALLTFLL